MTTLKEYLGGDARDDAFINDCATQATALVDQRCTGSNVPDGIKARAVLEVGAELYKRRATQGGTPSLEGVEMTPLRARNDPMKAAQFILLPFLEPGLA